MKNLKPILKEIKKEILLEKEKQKEINEKLSLFIKILKKHKIDFFVGGSIAKDTIIKKEKYDIDIFLRFKNEREIKNKFNKIIKNIKKKTKFKCQKIHGSRDYYNFYYDDIIFEIVPTIKLSSPKNAKNTTDLSYFHVSYVKNKIKKNKKLAEEIKLAKKFVFASGYYGAESHIKGFSGYAIELLIIYYKTFKNFIKNIASSDKKIIIDIEKFYSNKKEILNEINESKIQSPIILIDPTFKERNVTSALSKETFKKFQKYCKNFLDNPSKDFFSYEKMIKKRINNLEKKKAIKILIKTSFQEGSIAGSKLLKFYQFLNNCLKKYYKIKDKDFFYDNKKSAVCYFVLKKKDKLLIKGPPINKTMNVIAFKKKHKKTFIRKGVIYAEEKIDMDLKKIINSKKKFMKEIGIKSIKIL
ncbi:MAG: hypothetical protein QW117_02900 [Candidatus Pacearchaeota archaeon]